MDISWHVFFFVGIYGLQCSAYFPCLFVSFRRTLFTKMSTWIITTLYPLHILPLCTLSNVNKKGAHTLAARKGTVNVAIKFWSQSENLVLAML